MYVDDFIMIYQVPLNMVICHSYLTLPEGKMSKISHDPGIPVSHLISPGSTRLGLEPAPGLIKSANFGNFWYLLLLIHRVGILDDYFRVVIAIILEPFP